MSKETLKLVKEAWLKFGKKRETDVFPPYRRRQKELLKLCGTYPIGVGLPDWWAELLSQIKKMGWKWAPIFNLFESATLDEYKHGQFKSERHKECQEKLQGSEKKIISSPRIGKFLQEQFGVTHRFAIGFQNRGARYQEKEIVITADPWDIVNMSTRGKSWTSCQNFMEYNICEVWSNLCDPAMLVIFVRTKGDNSSKNADTRVILRYAYTDRRKCNAPFMRGVIIDRFYGDVAYIPAIQKLFLKLCRNHGLCLFEFANYTSHQYIDGDYQMTTDLKNVDLRVRGPAVKFLDGTDTPYSDNSNWVIENSTIPSYRLESHVHLIFTPEALSADV